MKAKIKTSQEEMKDGLAEMKAGQKEMECHSVGQPRKDGGRAKLHSTRTGRDLKNRLEDVLTYVNQWPQGLREAFNAKTEETQLGLQVASVNAKHHEELANTEKDLHKELNCRIQGTQVERETKRTPVETTWCELNTQLTEVKAQSER
jgi:hypothetical protein